MTMDKALELIAKTQSLQIAILIAGMLAAVLSILLGMGAMWTYTPLVLVFLSLGCLCAPLVQVAISEYIIHRRLKCLNDSEKKLLAKYTKANTQQKELNVFDSVVVMLMSKNILSTPSLQRNTNYVYLNAIALKLLNEHPELLE